MKILFCGLGSIGQAHIKRVQLVLEQHNVPFVIDAVRTTTRQLPHNISALLNKTYASIADAPDDYDVAFVTNPTAQHYDTVIALAHKAKSMFIEKPVFNRADIDIAALGLQAGQVYYVACPLRHHPVIHRLRELIAQTHVSSARAISSSYLPDWRPGVDYRQTYSANRALGGGVTLDLIHEWDYLISLFGFPEKVNMFAGHYSPLNIDSDDVAVYIAQYEHMLLSLHLDYVGRAPIRNIVLYADDEVIVGDILANNVTHVMSGVVETLPEIDFHLMEMKYFIDCVLVGQHDNMNTVRHALDVLNVALGGAEK